jgi:hypothetical protein
MSKELTRKKGIQEREEVKQIKNHLFGGFGLYSEFF